MDSERSRAWLYEEWAAGRGPRHVRVGGKVTILESPREFFERVARERDPVRVDPPGSNLRVSD
jgi:hypothetical protein